jgi:hypothetical protein
MMILTPIFISLVESNPIACICLINILICVNKGICRINEKGSNHLDYISFEKRIITKFTVTKRSVIKRFDRIFSFFLFIKQLNKN